MSDAKRRLDEHIENRPPHVTKILGDKPPSWEAVRAKMDELEETAEKSGTEEDKDAYFWFAEWMLRAAVVMIDQKLEESDDERTSK